MRFTCLQENLQNALSVVERIAGRNAALPILSAVLISTHQNRLQFVATDLELGATTWCAGKLEGEGRLALPMRLITQFVSNFIPQTKLQLDFNPPHLTVTTENSKATFRGLDTKDFPIIPAFTPLHAVTVPVKTLLHGLGQVLPAVATHEARPEINGVLFAISKNELKLAATDTFRLAEKIITTQAPDDNVSRAARVIVPHRTLHEVVRIFSAGTEDIHIDVGEHQLCFHTPTAQLISRLIAGEYPNYAAIIPTKFQNNTVVASKAFAGLVRGAAIFATKLNDIHVGIETSKRAVRVSAVDPDKGDHTATAPAEISGEPLEASFNYRYLLDGIEAIPTDNLEFAATSASTPAVIKPRGDPSFIYVIMPIRRS
ncbi:DNA polymerase III subunit beta [Candidatus Parcubacteria bacterium]|nr:DNA polymerase III subunit beta [Candidatus Parcubacteria bacterium]